MATLPDAQQQQKVPPGQEDQAAKDYHHSESKAGVVVQTPSSCVADFCLIPIGTPTASVSHQIADVQRLLKTCGLEYSMHSAGTTIEGSWDDVMRVIGTAHTMLHEKGVQRIQSDIRVGSRIDKKQSFNDKVKAVNDLLAKDAPS